MFKLIIKKQDGTIHWRENFDTLAEGQKWLNEEKTRPYWVATHTHEFIDMTPPPPAAQEIADRLAAENKRKAAVLALKGLENKPLTTAADIRTAVESLIAMLVG